MVRITHCYAKDTKGNHLYLQIERTIQPYFQNKTQRVILVRPFLTENNKKMK
jgi:hypothetical protein